MDNALVHYTSYIPAWDVLTITIQAAKGVPWPMEHCESPPKAAVEPEKVGLPKPSNPPPLPKSTTEGRVFH